MDKGKISDGYHTFDELYEFRMVYNAALFNEWAGQNLDIVAMARKTEKGDDWVKYVKHSVHKSWKHSDGELCFGGGWFIVCAKLPDGIITNHYKAEHWDLFKLPEVEKKYI